MKIPLKKPLTNMQRILILQAKQNGGSNYLSDLEREHFGTNARSRMRPYMHQYVQAMDGAFDDVYDDYLLYLWDQIQNPIPVGGTGGPGSPIGLLLALTQA